MYLTAVAYDQTQPPASDTPYMHYTDGPILHLEKLGLIFPIFCDDDF